MSKQELDIVEIGIDEAIAILEAAPIRIVEKPCGHFAMHPDETYTDPEIFHDGAWKALCLTDFCDDVATGSMETKTPEQWREYYRAKIHFGARFSDRRFSVIDSMTDG